MIDVDNPRVRFVLMFIVFVCAIYIVLSVFALMKQSNELQQVNQRICDDYSENQNDLGVTTIRGYADSICNCSALENGTWNCIYSQEKAGSMTKNLTRVIK